MDFKRNVNTKAFCPFGSRAEKDRRFNCGLDPQQPSSTSERVWRSLGEKNLQEPLKGLIIRTLPYLRSC
jgi:hypothetical protein